MQLEHWIKCLNNKTVLETFQVINAGRMGRGVATTRPFHKGDFVAEYTGVLVTGTYEIHGRRQHYKSGRERRSAKPAKCFEFQFTWKDKKHWSVCLVALSLSSIP